MDAASSGEVARLRASVEIVKGDLSDLKHEHVLVAEKESKIAEMDAASSGEAARLRASMETVKGDLADLKHEHEKQKEGWEAASQTLRSKLEIAEHNCIRAEIEAAKMRSQLESDVSSQARKLSTRDAELVAAKEEISRLEKEFSSYKVRAHTLLQKKEAELVIAKDSEQLKVLEESLKAEKEVLSISAERDRVLQDLQDTLTNHDIELKERDLVSVYSRDLDSTFEFERKHNRPERYDRNLTENTLKA
ncbi:Protein GRIP [Morella rubra]|uniref:Protein GRIP n=1 Tax=Morella rubra TaxID=262757 RepID=A0A6A1UH74_9ROSI|nr:Protein GRIP [Morella rubra]